MLGDDARTHDGPVPVWDVPLRLFHWLLAAAFAGAWLAGGDRWLHLHVFAGYTFGGLLLFRLLWGLWGEGHARFGRFAYGPRAVRAYLEALAAGRAPHYAGHNPAGSWAVYALLASGAALALSGLFALGGQEGEGPLGGALGFAVGAQAVALHRALAWLLLTLVIVHLAGVLIGSVVHRENLAAAMITGRKRAPATDRARPRRGVAALLVAAVGAGAVGYFAEALGTAPGEPYLPYRGPALPDDPLWRDECGACHLAFHPTLLPARSWRRLMAEQHRHFGEDLALGDAAAAIERFLTAHAAEAGDSEAGWYIARTTPPAAAPVAVTETPYWRRKHRALPDAVWRSPAVAGESDCAACHLDAEAGTFRDSAMRLPRVRPERTLPDPIEEITP